MLTALLDPFRRSPLELRLEHKSMVVDSLTRVNTVTVTSFEDYINRTRDDAWVDIAMDNGEALSRWRRSFIAEDGLSLTLDWFGYDDYDGNWNVCPDAIINMVVSEGTLTIVTVDDVVTIKTGDAVRIPAGVKWLARWKAPCRTISFVRYTSVPAPNKGVEPLHA